MGFYVLIFVISTFLLDHTAIEWCTSVRWWKASQHTWQMMHSLLTSKWGGVLSQISTFYNLSGRIKTQLQYLLSNKEINDIEHVPEGEWVFKFHVIHSSMWVNKCVMHILPIHYDGFGLDAIHFPSNCISVCLCVCPKSLLTSLNLTQKCSDP